MLSRLAGLLIRVLLETALMLLVIAALLGMLAFRTSRRLISSKDGKLDRFSGTAAPILASLLALQQAVKGEEIPSEQPPEGV
jgi:hypothetical protein